MGYYSGNGVTTGGGSNISLLNHVVWHGSHNLYQRTESKTTRKSGVSKETAENEKSDINMSTHTFTFPIPNGTANITAANCKGTKKQVSYTQINGSNLYELSITNETVQAKMDNGSWVSA